MNRRDFITGSAAALALSRVPAYAEQLADTRKRVGLIGSGWYGKTDLLRMIQVAPVEVVSLCDVDRRMLADAADLVATRQASKKKPRTYADYREMLKARDLDIVLIDTPDHWHALPMIEAVKSGLDVWVQKPISVDVVEGQAMLAAARKYKRVVQVGHAAAQHAAPGARARPRDPRRDGSARSVSSRSTATTTCAHARIRPTRQPPEYLDYEMWTGPAPMRPYNSLVHPRSWRAFMEYGNGIVGDMCVHMLDMVRWMLDLGMPARISFVGWHPAWTRRARRTSPTRRPPRSTSAICRSSGRIDRTATPPDPEVSLGRDVLRRQGHAQGERHGLRLHPVGENGQPIHEDVTYELDSFPRIETEKDLETHVAPGDPRAHEATSSSASSRAASRLRTSSRATSRRPPAFSPTCRWSSAAAAVGPRQGGRRRRRRSESAAPPAVS